MIGASRNGQVKTIEALFPFSKVPGRASAQRRGNLDEELVMAGIFLLKRVNKTLSSRHVNPLARAVIVQIIRVLDARKRGDHPT